MIKILLECRDEVEKKLYGNDRSVSGGAQSIMGSCNPIHLINTARITDGTSRQINAVNGVFLAGDTQVIIRK